MKYFLVPPTLFILLWLIATLVHVSEKRTPWLALAYLIAHILFLAVTTIVMMWLPVESKEYAEAYKFWSVWPMALAAVIAFYYSAEHGWHGSLGFLVVAFVCMCVSLELAHDVKTAFHLEELTPVIRWHFVFSTIFTACGVAAFLSLATPTGDVESQTKLALAGCWFVMGGYGFFYAIGKVNPHMAWIVRQTWVTTFAALVAFSWLVYKLNTSQREVGHQSLPEIHAMERARAAEVYEMVGLNLGGRTKT